MRCPQCASDNPPDYRFCGMCGTPLDKSAPVSASSENGGSRRAESQASTVNATRIAQAEEPSPQRSLPSPQSLSGPSFLGLSGEPTRSGLSSSSHDFKYLLEDEQPRRTYWRFTLILIILGGLGFLGWLEYSRAGKGWVAPWAKSSPQSPIQASQPQPSDPASQPASPAPAPSASDSGARKDENPAPSASAAAPNTAPPAVSDNSAMKETVTPDKKTEDKQETDKPEKTETASAQPAEKSADDSGDEADTSELPKPAKAAKAPKSKAAAVPAPSPDDSLVASAEKYLYGRGVPQNCDRALISLRAAAQRSNTRAQSLLGSMYATGHCVPRDLPNAYRWFALASRDNADNMWVQRNLEMIWREMTPQERQLATARSQ